MESVFFGFFQFALFNLPHPLPQGGKSEGNGNQVAAEVIAYGTAVRFK